MGLLLKVLSGPAGPWVLLGLVVALAGGGWWLRAQGYDAGVKDERLAWQQVAAKVREQAEQLAAERQARKDDAALARAERDRLYAAMVAQTKLEVQRYARSPAGAVRCVDDAGVRLGQAAIDAANQTIAAPAGRRK